MVSLCVDYCLTVIYFDKYMCACMFKKYFQWQFFRRERTDYEKSRCAFSILFFFLLAINLIFYKLNVHSVNLHKAEKLKTEKWFLLSVLFVDLFLKGNGERTMKNILGILKCDLKLFKCYFSFSIFLQRFYISMRIQTLFNVHWRNLKLIKTYHIENIKILCF